MDLKLLIAAWLTCAVAGAIVGSAKQSAGMGFLLGLLLGPLGVLAAFAIDGRRRCGSCASPLNAGAVQCPQCGREVSAPADDRLQRRSADDEATESQIAARLRQRSGLPPRDR